MATFYLEVEKGFRRGARAASTDVLALDCLCTSINTPHFLLSFCGNFVV
jgi:hypothetical protein